MACRLPEDLWLLIADAAAAPALAVVCPPRRLWHPTPPKGGGKKIRLSSPGKFSLLGSCHPREVVTPGNFSGGPVPEVVRREGQEFFEIPERKKKRKKFLVAKMLLFRRILFVFPTACVDIHE